MQDTDLIDECIDMILELEEYDTDEIDNHEFRMPDINIEKEKKTKKKLIPVLIVVTVLILAVSGTTSGVLNDLILMVKNETINFFKNDLNYEYTKNIIYYYNIETFLENENYDIELSFIPNDYILQFIRYVNNDNFVIKIEYLNNEYYIKITISSYYGNNFYKIIEGVKYSNIFLYYNNFFYNIECNNNILNEMVKSIELLGD